MLCVFDDAMVLYPAAKRPVPVTPPTVDVSAAVPSNLVVPAVATVPVPRTTMPPA